MRVNKRIVWLLACVMALSLMACGTEPKDDKELTIFAASSLTETLTEISELYKEKNPEVTIIFNFDSSGTLKTQIQEGADCDLFISAGQSQMDQVDVLEGTRTDLLENKIALCVSEICDVRLKTFDDLAKALQEGDVLMAMGNRDVPVGQYTQKILEYYDLNEEALARGGKISYASNAKEVTTQILEGSVDCGVIYCTDAYSAGLQVTDTAAAELCGQVIYPAAVLKESEHPEEAKAFLEFLQTDACMEVFEGVGFSCTQ